MSWTTTVTGRMKSWMSWVERVSSRWVMMKSCWIRTSIRDLIVRWTQFLPISLRLFAVRLSAKGLGSSNEFSNFRRQTLAETTSVNQTVQIRPLVRNLYTKSSDLRTLQHSGLVHRDLQRFGDYWENSIRRLQLVKVAEVDFILACCILKLGSDYSLIGCSRSIKLVELILDCSWASSWRVGTAAVERRSEFEMACQ